MIIIIVIYVMFHLLLSSGGSLFSYNAILNSCFLSNDSSVVCVFQSRDETYFQLFFCHFKQRQAQVFAFH